MQRTRLFVLLFCLTVLLSLAPASHPRSALADIPAKLVTLTFDDGPDPSYTTPILDLLQREQVPATFFVVGKNALQHPELIHRIQQEGHLLANHTLTHPHLEQLTLPQVRAELEGADAVLTDILGSTQKVPHYFRPPRGKISSAITKATTELGKESVLWNVSLENTSIHTPQQMRNRVGQLVDARNGGILLAHDGELDRTLTVQTLPLIIQDLKQKGYQFVSLDEYLAARDQQKTTRSQ